MNDLGWRRDGIERAMACGGVPLETYQRPGFTRGRAVRRADVGYGGAGFDFEDRDDYPPDIEIVGRRDRRR